MKGWLSVWASGETEASQKNLKSLGYWLKCCGLAGAAAAWPADVPGAVWPSGVPAAAPYVVVVPNVAVCVQHAGHLMNSGK